LLHLVGILSPRVTVFVATVGKVAWFLLELLISVVLGDPDGSVNKNLAISAKIMQRFIELRVV